LAAEWAVTDTADATYPMRLRVCGEHFVTQATAVTVKPGQDISAASLQAPDAPEATYRRKAGAAPKGYVANVTETCHPENPLQLIVKVQTAANTPDDGDLLAAALPAWVVRTASAELHTAGGYNGPKPDAATAAHDGRHIQTASRGGQPTGAQVPRAEFGIAPADTDTPQTLTGPQGQTAPVSPGRTRLQATFDIHQGRTCPLFGQRCPGDPGKHQQRAGRRFSQRQIDGARRRPRGAAARTSGQHLRPAIEATVRSLKHPFPNGKLPVRGAAA